MTQRKEHSRNEWDCENRRTPVWLMMLTSASCCRHVQQDSACSCAVRQDSDISTQGTAPVYVIDMSEDQINREAVKRPRHVLLRCADSSLNHEWSKTASFVSLSWCLSWRSWCAVTLSRTICGWASVPGETHTCLKTLWISIEYFGGKYRRNVAEIQVWSWYFSRECAITQKIFQTIINFQTKIQTDHFPKR
jgi:hypothetical protein